MVSKKSGRPKKASHSPSKREKAFRASGGLDRKLKERRKHQALKTKIDNRKALRNRKRKGKGPAAFGDDDEPAENADMLDGDILSGKPGSGFEGDDETASEDVRRFLPTIRSIQEPEHTQDESAEGVDDDLLDLDEGMDEVETHKLDLAKLKEQDPDFYRYLAENDRDLLDFDADKLSEGSSAAEPSATLATTSAKLLRASTVSAWAKAMLEHRSLKSLRSLLLAFRSVAFSEDEDAQERGPLPYKIENAEVFAKVVRTTLKYMPLVVAHHVPVKEGANGKMKVPTQASQYPTVHRLVKSFFSSFARILNQLADPETLQMAVNESARLVPYVLIDRRTMRAYLKALSTLWSSGSDNVRIASILAMRKIALASGGTYTEVILKNTYTSLVQAARTTNVFTLPSINLLKNSASELYLLQPSISYQLAFGYIRQLAMHLRNSMKNSHEDAFKAVYNWQVAHSIDFWSLVLSAACDKERTNERGAHTLEPLVYPFVEVTLGIARLVPAPRYFPFRFQLIRALLRISQRTGTLIPIAPLLLDLLDSAELRRKPKPSPQLKPLDFDYYIRAPLPYQRTKSYADGLAEEVTHLLTESYGVHARSVAFPELAFPGVVSIRRHAKKTASPKLGGLLKGLAEKLDAQRNFVERRRAQIPFAPTQRSQVAEFSADIDMEKTPLGMHLRRERKMREQKHGSLERAAQASDDDDEQQNHMDE